MCIRDRYKRGLVVTLKNKGGYDLYYWYDDPKKIYPAEISVDGTVVDPAGKIVHVGFHPELAGIIMDHTKSNPSHVRYLPQSYGIPQMQSSSQFMIPNIAKIADLASKLQDVDMEIVIEEKEEKGTGLLPYLVGMVVGIGTYYS